MDFLTKKQKVNVGEVPQYYVENSHPAIIEPEVFDLVQAEIKRRKTMGRQEQLVCDFPKAKGYEISSITKESCKGTTMERPGNVVFNIPLFDNGYITDLSKRREVLWSGL